MKKLIKVYAVHNDGTIFEARDPVIAEDELEAKQRTGIVVEIMTTQREPTDCTFLYQIIGELPE